MPEGNGFHPRFQRLRKVVQAKLTDRRRRVNFRLRQLGDNPVQTNDETVRELNGEITKLKRNLAVACKALGRPLTRPQAPLSSSLSSPPEPLVAPSTS